MTGNASIAGFKAHDATEIGWLAHGATGIAAQANHAQACLYGHCRAAGRAAGHPGLIANNEAVQRLFALTITATLVLATVNVSMDFLGWQCVRPDGGDSCGSSWTGWLSWPWLDSTGRRIAVTALLPLAVIALLWWLAHKTWAANEVTPVKEAAPAEKLPLPPLENRRMWNSAKPVRSASALATVSLPAAARP
jgi:hypothetical protein